MCNHNGHIILIKQRNVKTILVPSGLRTEGIASPAFFYLYESAEIDQLIMQYLRYGILNEVVVKGGM